MTPAPDDPASQPSGEIPDFIRNSVPPADPVRKQIGEIQGVEMKSLKRQAEGRDQMEDMLLKLCDAPAHSIALYMFDPKNGKEPQLLPMYVRHKGFVARELPMGEGQVCTLVDVESEQWQVEDVLNREGASHHVVREYFKPEDWEQLSMGMNDQVRASINFGVLVLRKYGHVTCPACGKSAPEIHPCDPKGVELMNRITQRRNGRKKR